MGRALHSFGEGQSKLAREAGIVLILSLALKDLQTGPDVLSQDRARDTHPLPPAPAKERLLVSEFSTSSEHLLQICLEQVCPLHLNINSSGVWG